MNEATDYEKYVQGIMQALLNAQGLETVTVQHNIAIQGLSRAHQIDVYWEYRIGGVLHRVIMNCKRYKHTVEVTDVLTLAGVLHDLPGVRGIIVTTMGFQKGAIEYATTHQIGLKVVRAPKDEDWEGRLRAIQLNISINHPILIDCQMNLDEQWVRDNLPGDPRELIGRETSDARTTKVRDLATNSVEDMNVLWNRAMAANPTDAGSGGTGKLQWENAVLERAGKPSVKILDVTFRWRIQKGEPIVTEIRSQATAIVKDAIAGTLLFIDPDGRVTGDVADEIGSKPSS